VTAKGKLPQRHCVPQSKRDEQRKLARIPRWTDEDAIAKLVDEIIAEGRSEIERLDWTYPPGGKYPDELKAIANLVYAEIYRDGWPPTEQAAVAAAMRRDLEPLADMLRPIANLRGLPYKPNPAIKSLSPDTWALIVEFLTGQRNLRTGRRKGEPGRPKMSAEERRARTPTHNAADEFSVIVDILQRLYPEQSAGQIRDRAEEIAKARTGARASVQTYRRRATKAPQRLG